MILPAVTDGNPTPTPVAYQTIAAGENVSLAVHDGQIFATGYDYYGQLGANALYTTKVNTFKSTMLKSFTSDDKISVGTKHVLATQRGILYGWGNNDSKQIDPYFTGKKGTPRALYNILNDLVSNDSNLAMQVEEDVGIRETINYAGDEDFFRIQSNITGELNLSLSSLNSYNITIYEGNAVEQTVTTGNGEPVIVQMDVTKDNIYYLKVSGQIPGTYSFKYHVLADDKKFTLSASLNEDNVTIFGQMVLKNQEMSGWRFKMKMGK